MTAPINARPIAISYEIICAAPRIPPSSAQRLFDAQPAEDDAVHGERRHREHVEDADVEIRDLEVDRPVADHQLIAERHGGEGDQHREDGQERRQEVQELVGARGHHVFLGEQLERVGDERVDEPEIERHHAEDVGAVGADAVLDERAALALDPQEDGAHVQHHQKNQQGFDPGDTDVDQSHANAPRRQT